MTLRENGDVLVYLDDMLENARRAQKFSAGRSFEDLEADDAYQFSVLHALQIIGEAARKVPAGFRAHHQHIPWPLIVGLRHVVVHDYGDIRFDKIELVLREEIPKLIPQLEALISLVESKPETPLPPEPEA